LITLIHRRTVFSRVVVLITVYAVVVPVNVLILAHDICITDTDALVMLEDTL